MNGPLAATPTSPPARRRATPGRWTVLLLALLLPLGTVTCVTVSPLIREGAILGPASETGDELAAVSTRPDMPYPPLPEKFRTKKEGEDG